MTMDPKEIESVITRKRAEDIAKLVVDKDKDRQRELASQTMNKKVFDIVELEDRYGDPVLVWVFSQEGTKDLKEGNKVVLLVLWPYPTCHPSESFDRGGACTKLGVRFHEAVFSRGKLLDVEGGDFLSKLQMGAYSH